MRFVLQPWHLIVLMELGTRRVTIAGIMHNPYGEWMEQVARNLTDGFDGFLVHKQYLILDREPLYTQGLCDILASAGVQPVRLPPRSPNLNPHCERFVLSVKSECLARMIFFGEAHLVRAVHSYVAHDHEERNHQGLGNRLIDGSIAAKSDGGVACRERLGGLLWYYRRQAA